MDAIVAEVKRNEYSSRSLLEAVVFSGSIYAIIIAMSLLTSVIAPPILKSLLASTTDEGRAVETEPSVGAGGEPPEVSQLIPVEETGHD